MANNPVVFVLGIGQGALTARWIKSHVDWLSSVVYPINFLAYKSTAEAAEASMHNLQQNLQGAAEGQYVLIAESQAAPPLVVRAIIDASIPQPRVLVLMQPLGLNTRALGATNEERYRSLMRRSRGFWLHTHQSPCIWGNRATIATLVRQTLPYLQRIKTAYTFGANQSIINEISRLSGIIPIHIYAADRDSLFPYDEIYETVSNIPGIFLHKLTGTHLNRATKAGLEQIETVKLDLLG